jgi:hypothetical protein
MKCKHDCGWLAIEDPTVFIFPSGYVKLNFGKDGAINKLKVICNRRSSGCLASRNVYLKGLKIMKWGRIKKLAMEEYKHDR